MRTCKWAALLLLAWAVWAMAGCASSASRTPVPEGLVRDAEIPGLRAYRFIGEDGIVQDMRSSLERLAEARTSQAAIETWRRPIRILAISGGGQNGAYGAGILKGWTAAGDRPEFQFVTGVSTGGLIAPFAFLGSDYDTLLEEVYTTHETKDFVRMKGMIAGLTSDSFTRVDGLIKTIEQFVTEDIVNAIGREHERGRRLWIGTTNLDAMEPTYWSVSGIAASEHPMRVALIRKILLASASIPVAFPPVYFEVQADGATYDEMHVDGGVTTQVFVYPLTVEMGELIQQVFGHEMSDPQVYIIRNSRLQPAWSATKPKTLSIAGRAVSSLITTQGVGDLYRIYLGCLRDGVGFNLARIPDGFNEKPAEQFDPAYMRELFDLGYEHALRGYPWESHPPDFALHESPRFQ